MSAEEFGEWQVIYAKERLTARAARFRHAQSMAAVMQGASTRRDHQPWVASHFIEADPWSPLPPASVPAANPGANILRQVKVLNRRHRKG